MLSWKRLACVLAASIVLTANVSAADGPIDDFTLPDFRGQQHKLSDSQDKQFVVVAFLGTECPLAKLYGPRLVKLSADYSAKGVAFIGINSNLQDSLTELSGYARQHAIEFPLLKDLDNKVADQFGAQRTPEVFVLDRSRTIRYRGRIDDQWGIGYVKDNPQHSELKSALDELLAGKDVTVAKTDPVGCLIGRVRKAPASGTVTYASHIAAIFNKRCVECHRPGEIGPFTLTSYDEAVGWASMIEEVVDQERMPPWHANPKFGHFANDRRLSDEEKSLIHAWVAGGAPAGDLSQAPPTPEFPVKWQIPREPDLVVKMRDKPYEVAATGEVRYQFFVVDPGFTEDKWVQASEVVPGNRAVVHHILIFTPGGATGPRADTLRDGAGGGFLSGYVPGFRTKPYPPGMAKRIPAGAKLVFQVHYTPNGTQQLDNSQLALWFADKETITHEVKSIANASKRLEIPPHEANYRAEATTAALPAPALLLCLSPHMHVRGKDFRYDIKWPGGREETLLDVPHYDFNWQTTYMLNEPLPLPAGTRIYSLAHFDNSADNLNNPDPSKTVKWGDQTWDEMMIGYFDLAIARSEADKVAVENSQEPARNRSAAADVPPDAKTMITLFDKDQDGKISSEEAPKRLKDAFFLLDFNRDGHLDEVELGRIPRR